MPAHRSTTVPPSSQEMWTLLRAFTPEGVIYLVRTAYDLGDDGQPKAVTKANRRRAAEALIEFGIATREVLDSLPYAEMMHRGRERLRELFDELQRRGIQIMLATAGLDRLDPAYVKERSSDATSDGE